MIVGTYCSFMTRKFRKRSGREQDAKNHFVVQGDYFSLKMLSNVSVKSFYGIMTYIQGESLSRIDIPTVYSWHHFKTLPSKAFKFGRLLTPQMLYNMYTKIMNYLNFSQKYEECCPLIINIQLFYIDTVWFLGRISKKANKMVFCYSVIFIN